MQWWQRLLPPQEVKAMEVMFDRPSPFILRNMPLYSYLCVKTKQNIININKSPIGYRFTWSRGRYEKVKFLEKLRGNSKVTKKLKIPK